MSLSLSSSPPQAQTTSPVIADLQFLNVFVTMIAFVVLDIGSFMLQVCPVNAPPIMISPHFPSTPPASASTSLTFIPIGTLKKTCASFPLLSFPTTVKFLEITGRPSSTAS